MSNNYQELFNSSYQSYAYIFHKKYTFSDKNTFLNFPLIKKLILFINFFVLFDYEFNKMLVEVTFNGKQQKTHLLLNERQKKLRNSSYFSL